jgi:hypothetical protein
MTPKAVMLNASSDWREALREIATRTRVAIEAHPWALDAEPRRPRRRINTMMAAMKAPAVDAEVAAAMDAGELPRLKRVFGRRGRRGPLGIPPATEFDQGLEWMLDGIESMAAS